MTDDSNLVRLALERGWISKDQIRSGRPLTDFLSPEQLDELRNGRDMASRLMAGGLLSAEDLVEEAPEKFGRYSIRRAIGEGGSGQVYLGHDPDLGRDVAVKILDIAATKNIDRFRREMEILASLKHPNIVTIFDAGVQDGRPFYAMEYVGERNFGDAKLDLKGKVGVLEEVARAVQAAHDKGIVHRDLKPANILMGEKPMVCDFGIAKTQDAELTETGHTLGTPYYMSPEQAHGREVDARADVYSLGVMLYESMTGKRPFTGTSVLEISRRIAEEEPQAPRMVDPHLPRDLEVIALRAMAKEPARRYATALEFADDLGAWMEGRPIKGRPLGFLERVGSYVRRKPQLAVAYGIAAALLVVIVVMIWQYGSWRGERIYGNTDARRKAQLQQLTQAQLQKINNWKINLYKPVREISYRQLEEAVDELHNLMGLPEMWRALRHQALFAIAQAHIWMGRVKEARSNLDEAIRIGKGDRIGKYHFERARIVWNEIFRAAYIKKEKVAERLVEQAKADLEAAKAAGFHDEWYRDFNEAFLILATKKNKGIEETFEALKLLATDKEKPTEEIFKMRGDLFLMMKEQGKAEKEYTEAIKSRQCYVQAWNGLAMSVLWKAEDVTRIRRGLEIAVKAIEINPRYEESYFLFVLLCRQAIRESPSELTKSQGEMRGVVQRVLDTLRKGTRVNPKSEALLVAHGTACVLGAYLRHSQKLDPTDMIGEARKMLDRALQINRNSFDAWYAQGVANVLEGYRNQENQKLLKQGEADLMRALEIDSQSPYVHRWLGYARFFQKDYDGAIEVWEAGRELAPNDQAEFTRLIDSAKKLKNP